jgi:uncharacterized membrane protein
MSDNLPEDADHKVRPTFFVALRNAFFTGLFLLAPLGVTILVLNFLLDNIGAPASKVFFAWLTTRLPDAANYLVSLISMLIVMALITVLGFASRYLFGRWLFVHAEGLILRVPGISLVYRGTKQIVDTFRSQKKAVFQKVVLVEFPRPGAYAIGFLTSSAAGEVRARLGEGMVNVFVPTTPNPTSGFLVICPARDVIELEMSVGDGMKMIISGGAVVPTPPRTASANTLLSS